MATPNPATPVLVHNAESVSGVNTNLLKLLQKPAFYKEDLKGVVRCQKVYKLIMDLGWKPTFIPHVLTLPIFQEVLNATESELESSTILAIAEDDKYRAIIRMDHTAPFTLYFHLYLNKDNEYRTTFAEEKWTLHVFICSIYVKATRAKH